MFMSRLFYAIVALFALWVGVLSYFDPALVVNAIPWPAPPFHARFIGALNLSVVVMCFWAAAAKSLDASRHMPLLIAVWSGVICIASFMHLEAYHYGDAPIWIWIAAYVVFPVVAVFLAFKNVYTGAGTAIELLPEWQKNYLRLQGTVLALLGAVLFFAPDLAAALWPWKINAILAQVYSGPLLAYGLVSFLVLRGGYGQAMIPITGMLVCVVLVLIASALHRSLFSIHAMSSWLWFAGLGVAAVSLGAFLLTGLRLRRVE
jgi:hypothetical protein